MSAMRWLSCLRTTPLATVPGSRWNSTSQWPWNFAFTWGRNDLVTASSARSWSSASPLPNRRRARLDFQPSSD